MLTLYIANKNYSSWSLRPWVLLKHLGIPFDEKLVPFAGSGPESGFLAFSPTGKVPCLVDGDITVWDSLAITEYVAESHPGVWPADKVARAWARSAAAEMHSGFSTVRNVCTMNCGIRVRLHEVTPALKAEWERIDRLWCEGLDRFGGPFLAGRVFTAVDAFFAPVAFRVQTYAPPLSARAAGYAEHLREIPAMKTWYDKALKEPWRDEPHDAEARAVGTWTADFRASPR